MFLDKLKSLFRNRNDQCEAAEPQVEYASPKNEYYAKVADRYSTVQMLLFVVLSLFLIIALLVNSEWISYENFYYFFSDFGDYVTSADSDIESIVYNTGNFGDFTVFGSKLAIAGKGRIELYTPSGRLAYSDSNSALSKPVLMASECYLMAYEDGGYEYRIYNIFTNICTKKTEYPIYGASMADNGSYALITGDGSHISSVIVYNRRFDEIMRIGRSSYVVGAALSQNGDRIATLSYTQEGGEFRTHVYISRTSKNTPYFEADIDNCFPLYCEFTEKGYLTVICEDRVISYNTYGKTVTEFFIPDGYSIVDAVSNRFGAVVLYKSDDGDNAFATVLNGKGTISYQGSIENEVSSLSLCNRYVLMQGADKIYRLDSINGHTIAVDKHVDGNGTMLARSENEIILCMSSRVKFLRFK